MPHGSSCCYTKRALALLNKPLGSHSDDSSDLLEPHTMNELTFELCWQPHLRWRTRAWGKALHPCRGRSLLRVGGTG